MNEFESKTEFGNAPLEPIPSYLCLPPAGNALLPSPTTRLQVLPFERMEWENFERLCLRLAGKASQVRCRIYGVKGQRQRGIDFYSFPNAQQGGFRLYQCKRWEKFDENDLKSIVGEFLKNDWTQLKPSHFIICVSKVLNRTQIQDELMKQTTQLANIGIEFELWDGESLSEKLKSMPELVDDFMGRTYVELFNGSDAAKKLGERLAGVDTELLRKRLLEVYQTIFERHDPGIPGANKISTSISYLQRYILPDLIIRKTVTFDKTSQSNITDNVGANEDELESGFEGLAHRALATPESLPKNHSTEIREPAFSWLPQQKRIIILGDPGVGKSSLLRAITLSLLGEEDNVPDLARAWGLNVPVWISFAAWTKAMEAKSVNLEDFFKDWLHKYSADDIVPLFLRALKDKKLLLLVDGLDERTSDESARIALDRLEAFLVTKDIPVIVTSRIVGYEKIQLPESKWKHAVLAKLSNEQILDLSCNWFYWLHLSSETDSIEAKKSATIQAKRAAEELLEELKATAAIKDLATVPLLLSLLISLKFQKSRLPEHKTRAFDEMVNTLLTTQPNRRRQASGVVLQEETLPFETLKDLIAHLALKIQESSQDSIPIDLCRTVMKTFLEDDRDGAGFSVNEAQKCSLCLIEEFKHGFGLLIEKGMGEIGFVHLSLQEYLAAWAITKLSEVDQLSFCCERKMLPRWKEIVLSVIGIEGIIRGNRAFVDKTIDSMMQSAETDLEKLIISPLIAEIIFGELGATPKKSKILADELMLSIEKSPFFTIRQTILKSALKGLRSQLLREQVMNKIKYWFPARSHYVRKRILEKFVEWEPEHDLKETLIMCFYDESDECRIAGARILAKVFKKDQTLKDLVFNLAENDVSPNVREAAITAIVTEWIDDPRAKPILDRGVKHSHVGIRFQCIKGRIRLGIQGEDDLDNLINMANSDSNLSFSVSYEDLPTTLLQGWPNNPKLKQVCLENVEETSVFRDRMNKKVSLQILLRGFPGDNETAHLLANLIKADSFFYHEVWPLLAEHYKGIEELQLATERMVCNAKFIGPDECYAAVVSGTERTKKFLIDQFPTQTGHGYHWVAKALIEGWSYDEEVLNFLRKQAYDEIKVSSVIADLFGKFIVEKNERKNLLVSIMQSEQNERPEIALRTIIKEGFFDDDILNISIDRLSKPMWDYCIDDFENLLVKERPADPRVRKIAMNRLSDPEDYIQDVVVSYKNDSEIRSQLLNMVKPLPTLLRRELVKEISSEIIPSKQSISILKESFLEEDGISLVAGVSALASKVKQGSDGYIPLQERLEKDLKALGMRFEIRRSAAIVGLLRMNLANLILKGQDKIKSNILLFDRGGSNFLLVEEILRNWSQLEQLTQGRVLEAFGIADENFWEAAAGTAINFPAARQQLENYLISVTGKPVNVEIMELIAKTFPKSLFLSETCLANIRLTRKDGKPEVPYAAAQLLAENFSGDEEIHNTIDKIKINAIEMLKKDAFMNGDYEEVLFAVILTLCQGWPSSPLIDECLKFISKLRKGTPYEIAFFTYSIKKTDSDYIKLLDEWLNHVDFFNNYRDKQIINSIISWLQKDERRKDLLIPWLNSNDATKLITAVSLLLTIGNLDENVLQMLESIFLREATKKVEFPTLGYDYVNGKWRTIADVTFEVLVKN